MQDFSLLTCLCGTIPCMIRGSREIASALLKHLGVKRNLEPFVFIVVFLLLLCIAFSYTFLYPLSSLSRSNGGLFVLRWRDGMHDELHCRCIEPNLYLFEIYLLFAT